MIKETITIAEALDTLNSAVKADPVAMLNLVENRVPCNKIFADHPSIQVSVEGDGYAVGLLGILNGLFGTNKEGWGPIAGVFEDDGTLTKFERTKKTIPCDPS